jgi:kumamolisin
LKPKVWAMRRHSGVIVAIGTAGSLVLLTAGTAVAATHPPSKTRVAVSQGLGAASLRNSRVIGTAAADTQETVSFVLKERDLSGLKSAVNAGMPHGHVTVAKFASKYGQPMSKINALTSFLTGFGITSTVHADHIDVTTTGTVADYNAALGVMQSEFLSKAIPARSGHPGRGAVRFHGTTQPTTLPGGVASFVLSILGLTNYPTGVSDAVHTPAVAPAAKETGNLKPSNFASRYHLNTLQKKGAKGKGQTIGIVTLASMTASDATHFWNTTLKIKTKAHRLTLTNIDGGAGPVSDASGSGETTLDVEQSGALATQANVVVYQAPNSDAGFFDGFATAASQNKAGSVSSSWGESETAIKVGQAAHQETSTYAKAFDEIFLELAAQGQASFVSAGDSGAYDASGDVGSTNLSVDNPGDSPWITVAGGTTLPGTIPLRGSIHATIKAQRAWGWDWLWAHWKALGQPSEKAFAFQEISGGGGGFSNIESTPGYQTRWLNVHKYSAVKYLTPINKVTSGGVTLPTSWSFKAKPKVIHGTGKGRALPDLSADADPFTGYEEYFTGFTGSPLEVGWGGTSFVAPQLAGATAVIDSFVHHRVGFWNPKIYHFASERHSPFHPLTTSGRSNDNLFYSGTKGHLYNPATGLGTPNFAKLAADFRH